jgi:hypothetical protein
MNRNVPKLPRNYVGLFLLHNFFASYISKNKLINEKIETNPKIYNIKYVHGHTQKIMANPKTQIYFCRPLLTRIDTTNIIPYFQGYYGTILLNNLIKSGAKLSLGLKGGIFLSSRVLEEEEEL